MRKKIMMTILGTAMLFNSSFFYRLWKISQGFYKCEDGENHKRNKKEKRRLKIKILSKYDQIKKLLSKYPKEMTAEDTSYQGIVVIEYDSFGKGSKKSFGISF